MGLADLTSEDYEEFRYYLESLKGDPLRIAILAAQSNHSEFRTETAIAFTRV